MGIEGYKKGKEKASLQKPKSPKKIKKGNKSFLFSIIII